MAHVRRSLTSLSLALAAALGVGVGACDPPETDANERVVVVPPEGCTHSPDYWRTHHAGAENPAQQLPWPQPNTVVCTQTWLEILQTPAQELAWYTLAHQWIAASLNVAAGSDPPEDAALSQAEALLSDCVVVASEHDLALTLAAALADFNSGEVGPGSCGDEDIPDDEPTPLPQ